LELELQLTELKELQ
jgi:hypothetical protein